MLFVVGMYSIRLRASLGWTKGDSRRWNESWAEPKTGAVTRLGSPKRDWQGNAKRVTERNRDTEREGRWKETQDG